MINDSERITEKLGPCLLKMFENSGSHDSKYSWNGSYKPVWTRIMYGS